MRIIVAIVLMLGTVGCNSPNTSQPFSEARDILNGKIQWQHKMSTGYLRAANRMYECTSEIYETGDGGGPVCREACSMYSALISHEKEHPDWVSGDPLQMPDKEVCNGRLRKGKVSTNER